MNYIIRSMQSFQLKMTYIEQQNIEIIAKMQVHKTLKNGINKVIKH